MSDGRPSVERKYALIRVGRGDYLLPANDDRTLWRIHTYTEDGWLEREVAPGRYRPVTGEYWALEKFKRSIDGGVPEFVDPLDWGEWEQWDAGFRTRAEAIDAALGRHA